MGCRRSPLSRFDLRKVNCSVSLNPAVRSEGSNQLAVHHYRFGLLPRGPLIAKFGTLPKAVIAGTLQKHGCSSPRCEVMCLIDAFRTSVSVLVKRYIDVGSENGNRIHVVYEDRKIVEVSCRIAVSREHQNFAAGVVSLAESCDWLIVLTNETLAEPKSEVLLTAVRNSNAAKFATNPLEFIEGLSTGMYHPE